MITTNKNLKGRSGIWPLLIIGVSTAVVVALIFRLIPDTFPARLAGRAVLFLVAVTSAPIFVGFVRWCGRLIGTRYERSATIATIGALIFDSTVTGFAPQLYGHSGTASATVLASIVFGGISIIAVEHTLVIRRNSGETGLDDVH